MNDSLEKSVGCFLRYRSFPHDISPFSAKRYFKLDRHPTLVCDENDVDKLFTEYCSKIDFSKTGIMLSGGIDSVLLASYMPKGSYAFTISYPEMKQKDEVEKAKHFAEEFSLKLVVVPVTFEDVLKYQDELMKFKGQPLATIEIGIYKMCLEAKKCGLTRVLSGMGADGTFGGTFLLMSRDWTNKEFVDRFTYIDPAIVMKKPVDSMEFYELYYGNPYYNLQGFLDDVETEYTIAYFMNPCELSGIKLYVPYEDCKRGFELSRDDMLNGREKIVLRKLFKKRLGYDYEGIKYAFPRPTEHWLKLYDEKLDEMFFEDSYSRLKKPEQKWVLYTTNHFIRLFSSGKLGNIKND